jgi:hypothetical protein
MPAIVRLFRDRLSTPDAAGPDHRVPNPALKRAGDLGSNQLAWLRANVHGFATDERLALDARAHTERSRGAS